MKINELEVGMKVVDSWYWSWGIGTVRKVLKTRVVIAFTNGTVLTYDKPHLGYLSRGIYK